MLSEKLNAPPKQMLSINPTSGVDLDNAGDFLRRCVCEREREKERERERERERTSTTPATSSGGAPHGPRPPVTYPYLPPHGPRRRAL